MAPLTRKNKAGLPRLLSTKFFLQKALSFSYSFSNVTSDMSQIPRYITAYVHGRWFSKLLVMSLEMKEHLPFWGLESFLSSFYGMHYLRFDMRQLLFPLKGLPVILLLQGLLWVSQNFKLVPFTDPDSTEIPVQKASHLFMSFQIPSRIIFSHLTLPLCCI